MPVASWNLEIYPISWISIAPDCKVQVNSEVTFQVGAIRPKDKDADVWVCGLVKRLHLYGERPYADVALLGDSVSIYDTIHPEAIEIKYLVPSTNFLLKSSPRFNYFGNARGNETASFFWADRVVDSTGVSACLQSRDVIRWTALDFLLLGFVKISGEMSILMFLEPHTKDDSESVDNLFERVCVSTVGYMISNFPMKRSGTAKMVRGICPFYELPPETKTKLDIVYKHVSVLAYNWAKKNAKFKPFSSLSKTRAVPVVSVKGSERINAHKRVFGHTIDEDSDIEPFQSTRSRSKTSEVTSTSESTKSRSKSSEVTSSPVPKSTKTPSKSALKSPKTSRTTPTSTQPKRKAPASPSKKPKKVKVAIPDDADDEIVQVDDDEDEEFDFYVLPPKSPKHPGMSQVPAASSSPSFIGTQNDRTASLEEELKLLRQQQMEGLHRENEALRSQLRSSEADVTKLRMQLEAIQSEKAKLENHVKTLVRDSETNQNKLHDAEQALQQVQTNLADTRLSLEESQKLVFDLRSSRVNMDDVQRMVRTAVELGFDARQSTVVDEFTKFRATTTDELSKVRSDIHSLGVLFSVSFLFELRLKLKIDRL